MISDETIESLIGFERETERKALKLRPFNPLDYIKTQEALEAYVQERIRLDLDLIKMRPFHSRRELYALQQVAEKVRRYAPHPRDEDADFHAALNELDAALAGAAP